MAQVTTGTLSADFHGETSQPGWPSNHQAASACRLSAIMARSTSLFPRGLLPQCGLRRSMRVAWEGSSPSLRSSKSACRTHRGSQHTLTHC